MNPPVQPTSLSFDRIQPILAADAFDSLLKSLEEVLAASCGVPLRGCALTLLLPETGGFHALIVNNETIRERRHISPRSLGRAGVETISALKEPGRIGDLGGTRPGFEAWTNPPLKLADGERAFGAPLRRQGMPPGLLLAAVDAADAAVAGETICRVIGEVSGAAALALSSIYAATALEDRNRQVERIQISLTRSLTAVDRASLLNQVMTHLTRELGFDRVQILLYRAETQQLHCAMHTGFASAPQVVDGDAEQRNEYFSNAIKNGEVAIFTPDQGEFSLVPNFGTRERTGRLAILPLRIGAHMIGCIYMEQDHERDGMLFYPVLDTFAKLTAVALDNLDQRIAAESRAETDPLTGLHNRYYLDKVLSAEVPRVKRYDTPISLLMIDLCNFKITNDTYGHTFGDYCLRETANLIRANVRRPDIVVRYGGDEFVVLMVNTDYEQAQMLRNRIEQAFIERNRMQTEERMKIVISVGLRSANAVTIGELIENADEAMYVHKASIKRRSLLMALLYEDMEKIESQHQVVASLSTILHKKIPYYAEHARRVCHLCLIIARRLGLRQEEAETLALAAMLHDVGKVSLPSELLNKKDAMIRAEVQAMQKHPVVGEMFFEGIDYLEPIRPAIRHHHEAWDGQERGLFGGYPDKLEGEEIPLAARILGLAENADGMLGGRPYLSLVSLGEIEQYIRRQSGSVFDPKLTALLEADKGWHHNLGRSSAILELLQTF